MPKTKIIDVYSSNPHCGKLVDLIDFLNRKLSEIPEELRANAHADIEIQSDYGDTYAVVSIYYHRPFTDEELEAEEKRLKANLVERKWRMLKELEELEKQGI